MIPLRNTAPMTSGAKWLAAVRRVHEIPPPTGASRRSPRADVADRVAGCRSGPDRLRRIPASPQASSSAAAPITIGQTSVPKTQDPLKASWILTAVGVAEYPYMLNADGTQSSRFFTSATQDDDLNWTLQVKTGATFSDGSPVDAQAIADSLNAIQRGNPQSNASAGVISFASKGDTITATTQRKTRVLPSVLGEFSNVIFKADGKGGYLYTGPYQVTGLDAGNSIDSAPNPSYPDASKRGHVTVKAFPDADAMKLAIQSGALDMAFTVTPTVAEQLSGVDGLSVKTIDAGYQYFVRPNLQRGPLADATVRKALDLGLDRTAFVQALKGGSVANGLFAHYYSFAGQEKVVTDTAAAKALLDEAGWLAGPDGVRVKDGQKLSLSLITYASRPDLGIIMHIMVSQLGELGIAATTSVVDDIRTAMTGGAYDLAMYAQHTAPTGEPSFFLNQFFRTGGANNLNGYSSATTDGLLDELGDLAPGAQRDAKAIEIQQQIHRDNAALLLVDPQWHIAVSKRLADYQPYCGDYYVVNPQLGLS